MKYSLPIFQIKLLNESTGQPLSLYIGNIPILVSNKEDTNEFNWIDISNEKIPSNTDGPFLPSETKILLNSTMNNDINTINKSFENKNKGDVGWYGLILGMRAFPSKNGVVDVEKNEKNGTKNRLNFTGNYEVFDSQKKLLKSNQSLCFMPTICLIRYDPNINNDIDNNTNRSFHTLFLNYRDAVFWNDSSTVHPSINENVSLPNLQLRPLLWGILTLDAIGKQVKTKWIKKNSNKNENEEIIQKNGKKYDEISWNLPLFVSKLWSILSIHNGNYVLYATAINENKMNNEDSVNDREYTDIQYLVLSLPGDPSLDFLKADYDMNQLSDKRTLILLPGERVIDVQYQTHLIPDNYDNNSNNGSDNDGNPIGIGVLTTLRVLILMIPSPAPPSSSFPYTSASRETSLPAPSPYPPSNPHNASLAPLQISNSHIHSSIINPSNKKSSKISSKKQGILRFIIDFLFSFLSAYLSAVTKAICHRLYLVETSLIMITYILYIHWCYIQNFYKKKID